MDKDNRAGAVKKNEAPKDRSERSPMYYYNCAHGASNKVCPEHFPGQSDMPDDWMVEYASPTASGIIDDITT